MPFTPKSNLSHTRHPHWPHAPGRLCDAPNAHRRTRIGYGTPYHRTPSHRVIPWLSGWYPRGHGAPVTCSRIARPLIVHSTAPWVQNPSPWPACGQNWHRAARSRSSHETSDDRFLAQPPHDTRNTPPFLTFQTRPHRREQTRRRSCRAAGFRSYQPPEPHERKTPNHTSLSQSRRSGLRP